MSQRPLMVSVLFGLIVVLFIIGVSLMVKMNSAETKYNKTVSESIVLSKSNEELKEQNTVLNNQVQSLTEKNTALLAQVDALKLELKREDKLKDKLEDNLKDELMKNEPVEPKGN
jgi:uncharacterized protein YlxW (UPF0749 family)